MTRSTPTVYPCFPVFYLHNSSNIIPFTGNCSDFFSLIPFFYQGEELESAAKIIGYGAVKYFDLKQHPATNYIFSYDRMLDTKGKSMDCHVC